MSHIFFILSSFFATWTTTFNNSIFGRLPHYYSKLFFSFFIPARARQSYGGEERRRKKSAWPTDVFRIDGLGWRRWEWGKSFGFIFVRFVFFRLVDFGEIRRKWSRVEEETRNNFLLFISSSSLSSYCESFSFHSVISVPRTPTEWESLINLSGKILISISTVKGALVGASDQAFFLLRLIFNLRFLGSFWHSSHPFSASWGVFHLDWASRNLFSRRPRGKATIVAEA